MFAGPSPIPDTPNIVDIHTAAEDVIDAASALRAEIKTYFPNKTKNELMLAFTLALAKIPSESANRNIFPLLINLNEKIKIFNTTKKYLLNPTSTLASTKSLLYQQLALLLTELSILIAESNKRLTEIWSQLFYSHIQKAMQAMTNALKAELASLNPKVSETKSAALDTHTSIHNFINTLNTAAVYRLPDAKFFTANPEFDAIENEYKQFATMTKKILLDQSTVPPRELTMQLYYAAYAFRENVKNAHDNKSILNADKTQVFSVEYANKLFAAVCQFHQSCWPTVLEDNKPLHSTACAAN